MDLKIKQRVEEAEEATVKYAVKSLVKVCHGDAYKNGWWTDIETGETLDRPVPEALCLVHSEISEALEAFRKNLNDDKLTHRDGFTVELADALIRIFDIAGGYNLDLEGALYEKLLFNRTRQDHKIEERLKENGKKI